MKIKYIVCKNTVKVDDDFLTKEKIIHDESELWSYLQESKSFKFVLEVKKVVDKQV